MFISLQGKFSGWRRIINRLVMDIAPGRKERE